MAFGQAADGRVAGHGPDGVGVDDRDKGPAAHSRRGQGRLAAGMAGADYGNIIFIHGVRDGGVLAREPVFDSPLKRGKGRKEGFRAIRQNAGVSSTTMV